jgi:asparagine synthase (glutamine-hydrolysing)
MGAIAGILPRTSGADREGLATALAGCRDAMRRRAPIEGGMAIAYDASIALAHRASEGPGGEAVLQPLRNETGTLWLVADGEPSNAADLRLELIGAGHHFQSACGSEVILHLYEHEGVSAFERLTGAFAFALWDREQRQLILGRDRFGEKPLYILEGAERFAFASEVHALDPGAPLAPAAVTAFLALGYMPEPLTVAPAVRALPPGTFIRVRGVRSRAESFWDHASVQPSGDAAADRVALGRLVRESVQAAVVGEEDVGIVLDGSLTRAALLALVSPTLARGLRTHTLLFDAATRPAGAIRGERATAVTTRALAGWFRSEHCEHRVGAAEFAAAFEAAASGDQPAIGGTLAHLTAAYLSASGDRVLLSGLGGSELLGLTRGRFSPWVWRAARRSSGRVLARTASRLAARMRPFGSAGRVADALVGADAIAAAHLAARGLFGSSALTRVVRADVLAEARAGFEPLAYVRALASRVPEAAFLPATRSARDAAVRVAAALERGGRLVSGRLRETESAAAALGLALRTPYLDHRLCDWLDAATSPRGGMALLAEVLGGTLPPPFRHRVRPATPPVCAWLRAELRPLVEGHLFADDPEGFFLRPGIEDLWRGVLAGRVGWRQVWPVAVLRAWIAARRGRDGTRSSTSVRDQHAA